jgi:hypothetical protein
VTNVVSFQAKTNSDRDSIAYTLREALVAIDVALDETRKQIDRCPSGHLKNELETKFLGLQFLIGVTRASAKRLNLVG